MKQGRLTLIRPYAIEDGVVEKVSNKAPEFPFLMQLDGGIHQAGRANVRVKVILCRDQGKNNFLQRNTFGKAADGQVRVIGRDGILGPLADPMAKIPINSVSPIVQFVVRELMI